MVNFDEIINCGIAFYDEMTNDGNHRYLSWEHCHEAFRSCRFKRDHETIDYLSLHLSWYLASWGMLRNSFLMQKDYKIHSPIVQLILDKEWEDLWDITPQRMAQKEYAAKIIKLSETISKEYTNNTGGVPTDTLLTKILLGTLGCVPAYDRYFKRALSVTKVACGSFNVKSIMKLGSVYLDHREKFEECRSHCSNHITYPPAKIIDMCLFEYGLQIENKRGKDDDIVV